MSGWLRLTVTGRVRSCSSAAFARVTSTSSLFSIRRMAPAVSTWKWSGTHHVRSRGTSASRRLPLVVRTTISAAAEASSTTAFTSPAWCGFGDQLRSCCRQIDPVAVGLNGMDPCAECFDGNVVVRIDDDDRGVVTEFVCAASHLRMVVGDPCERLEGPAGGPVGDLAPYRSTRPDLLLLD